jgi:hypothetical protein
MEDLAYRRMIDLYYLHERPLNGCSTDIGRDIGMMEYTDEIEYVLRKFFTLHDDGLYHNKRIDEEIAKYQSKVANAQKAGLASAKARAKATSVERPLNKRATKQETRNKKQETVSKRKKAKAFVPPTLDDVVAYAKERKQTADLAKRFFEYFDTGGWKDAKGNKVNNWKQKFITWESFTFNSGDESKPEPAGVTSHMTFEENQKLQDEHELKMAQKHGFKTAQEYADWQYREQMKKFGQEV